MYLADLFCNFRKKSMEINDEEINALSWTITYLKSKIWLFNKRNAEVVRELEILLDKITPNWVSC